MADQLPRVVSTSPLDEQQLRQCSWAFHTIYFMCILNSFNVFCNEVYIVHEGCCANINAPFFTDRDNVLLSSCNNVEDDWMLLVVDTLWFRGIFAGFMHRSYDKIPLSMYLCVCGCMYVSVWDDHIGKWLLPILCSLLLVLNRILCVFSHV